MGDLLIIRLWRHGWPAAAAITTMVAVFLWPSIPLGSVSNWFQFFYFYTPQNYLYATLTVLSGLYVGAYTYNKKVSSTCQLTNKSAGAVGVFGGILLGACPACIPALAIFLPLGVTVYLSRISWVFLVLGIAIVAFLIYRMNGFRKIPR